MNPYITKDLYIATILKTYHPEDFYSKTDSITPSGTVRKAYFFKDRRRQEEFLANLAKNDILTLAMENHRLLKNMANFDESDIYYDHEPRSTRSDTSRR